MGMFSSKEDKEERQQELLEQYGLSGLDDDEEYNLAVELIQQMKSNDLATIGAALGSNPATASMLLQKTLVYQNFIIIHELNRMNKILSVLDK